MAIEAFQRREKKFVITRSQYEILIRQLPVYMRPDKFGINGQYTVTSLYFESPDLKIYRETKDKLPYRGKLRLRVYDKTTTHDIAFFELKLKYKKSILKRRTMLTLAEAYRYLAGSDNHPTESYMVSNLPILQEIDHFRRQYHLRPKMIVSYRRHAFHGIENSDLRVTFDFSLQCRNHNLLLENGPYGENFLDANMVILEVKSNGDHIPFWLQQILQNAQCSQKNFSKFCIGLEHLNQ